MNDSFLTKWDREADKIPFGPLGVITMPGCEEIGEKINHWLKKWNQMQEEEDQEYFTTPGQGRDNFLVKCYCPRFGTGEGKGVIKDSVRGYDIYIIVDVCAHQKTYKMYGVDVPMSPDDHFQDVKRVISAIAGKAKRISLIMPMLYESRQHKRSGRESLDCAIALQELARMGVSNIITFDAHDPRVQNAIPLCGFENVMPTYQMIKALCRNVKDLHIDKNSMMVVSPDEGAMQRNIYYSSVLGLDLGMFYKRRDYTKVVNGRNPIVAHEYLGADVEGKDIIVVDDMIASGDSLLDLCRELKSRRCGRIFGIATFAFFTSGIEAFREAYEKGLLCRIIVSNASYYPTEVRSEPWFIEADLSKYISYMIATLNHDHSLHKLLNPYDKIQNLLRNYQAEQTAAGIRLI